MRMARSNNNWPHSESRNMFLFCMKNKTAKLFAFSFHLFNVKLLMHGLVGLILNLLALCNLEVVITLVAVFLLLERQLYRTAASL